MRIPPSEPLGPKHGREQVRDQGARHEDQDGVGHGYSPAEKRTYASLTPKKPTIIAK
jgi:hypothetical protein